MRDKLAENQDDEALLSAIIAKASRLAGSGLVRSKPKGSMRSASSTKTAKSPTRTRKPKAAERPKKSVTRKSGEQRGVTEQREAADIAIPQGADNSSKVMTALRAANAQLRKVPWPAPFNHTHHRYRLGDARDLSWLPDDSVHLVVTSPPYWTLKQYEPHKDQLGDIEDYEKFLAELDKVWRECARILAPGGRICCVVGDVCLPRKKAKRHHVMPLHADIQVRARSIGLDCLTPVLWHKIANGATEVEGNGAGFYGKPYQPGAVVKNDIEYVLFLRKGGTYRKPTSTQKALSMLTKEEMQSWWRSIWTDIKGASTRSGHPAPYPVELAERLIKMFSFAGDVVLDPFGGAGSTSLAALRSGRSSILNEIEPTYFALARKRMLDEIKAKRVVGAVSATMSVDGGPKRRMMVEQGGDLFTASPISRASA